MGVVQVEGVNRGDVMLYALSTCGWCKRTKALLSELGVAYRYVDVDKAEGDERESLMDEVEKWNPSRSFPTMVIDDKTCIVGFDEYKVKKELGA